MPRLKSAHGYETHAHWTGSTADGIRAWSRTHTITTPPATAALDVSADPAFRGDAALWNPEQLVVAAASSCQMLSFLGEAARAGVTVLGYDDIATATLLLDEDPARLSAITLEVTVQVPAGTDHARIDELAEAAHRACFIANSLAVPVEVTTTVVER